MQVVRGHSFRKVVKRALFRNAASQWLICAFMWFYIRLVYHTSRVERDFHPDTMPYANGEKNAVYAFWHGRLMMMPMLSPPGRKMHVMISSHHDGLIIARTMEFFGFGIVQGSSRKGGRAAAVGAIEALEKGDNVSITPDGPKGPQMKVQQGAVTIARLTGRPIVPVTYAARPCRRFKSWDRFVIGLPFCRIVYRTGAPIWVESDDTALAQLEAVMVEQTNRLEADMGQE